MSSPAMQPVMGAVVDVLVDSSLKAFVLLLFVAIVDKAARKWSPATKHLVWNLTVSTTLILPVVTAVSPARLGWTLLGSAPPPETSISRQSGQPVAAPSFPATIMTVSQRGACPQMLESVGRSLRAKSPFWLAAYFVGLVAVLGRMLFARSMLRRIHTRSVATARGWTVQCAAICEALGYKKRVEVVQSRLAQTPFVFGAFRPVLVVPEEAATWPPERIRVVLIHELAHVVRRDCLTQAVAQLACAVYWFNPLVWRASQKLKSSREGACDDAVLEQGVRPSVYAGQLLQIAQEVGFCRQWAEVALTTHSDPGKRLTTILDPSQPRQHASFTHKAIFFAIAFSVVVATAPLRLVARTNGPDAAGRQATISHAVDGKGDQAANAAKRLRGTPRSVEAAIEKLSSTNPQERGAAACSLGEMHPASVSAIPALIRLLSDRTPIETVLCGDRRQWRDEDPGSSPGREAAMSLGNLGEPAVLPLLSVLQSQDWSTRSYATYALATTGDRRAVEPILALVRDENPTVRKDAAWALGCLDDGQAVLPLISSLQDTDAKVRYWSAWALGSLNDARAVPPLISSLRDPDPRVRQWAAWALGSLDDGRAVSPLISSLHDLDASVRQWAAQALGALNDSSAKAALAVATRDDDPKVRASAKESLRMLEGK